jgi:CRP/FNR family cyclic AMP-dependent transcriptional regulator
MPDADDRWTPTTFLGRLPAPTREVAIRLGRPRVYQDGDDVLVEGTTAPFVVLLMQGWFKVVATMETGREALVAIRVGGDLVGEMGGVDGEPRVATVRSSGRTSARTIGRTTFLAFLAEHPAAVLATNRVMADRLRMATRRQVEFATLPTEVRVARILAELAAAHGQKVPGGVMLSVVLTQTELATLAGTTEPTVHRALSALRRHGVIETGYRRIVVLDRSRLAERADG